jgi:PPP family 3-phenylpropionic acid transporter
MSLRIAPLTTARIFYFLFYAAWASLLPFLALYYQGLGLRGGEIGILTGIPPLITLFSAPFWGGLADATNRHRQVLLAIIAGAMLSILALSQGASFWLLLPCIAAYAFFNAPVIPLIDNSVLALLGGRREEYGKQRLWGAVGWGAAAPVTGWLVDKAGIAWSFIVYLVLMCAGFLTARHLHLSQAGLGNSFRRGVGQLLSNRRWLLFLFIVFLNGSGISILTNFLFLYMNELGIEKTVMGLGLTIATVSELPVLFYSGQMLRRLGARGLLIISLAAYVIRAFGYSVVHAPLPVLALQFLHGLTFAAMWAAGVSFAGEIAPPGLGATAQSMFYSTVMGFGGMAGALAGGILLERLGGAGMFRWSGMAVLIGLLLLIVSGQRGLHKESDSNPVKG